METRIRTFLLFSTYDKEYTIMKRRFMVLLLAVVLLLSLESFAFAEELTEYIPEGSTDIADEKVEAAGVSEEEIDLQGFIEIENIDYGDGRTGFIYNDEWLLQDASALSGDLAKVSMALAGAAYDEDLVREMMGLGNMGYTIVGQFDYQPKNFAESDSVAFTVGRKTVEDRTV